MPVLSRGINFIKGCIAKVKGAINAKGACLACARIVRLVKDKPVAVGGIKIGNARLQRCHVSVTVSNCLIGMVGANATEESSVYSHLQGHKGVAGRWEILGVYSFKQVAPFPNSFVFVLKFGKPKPKRLVCFRKCGHKATIKRINASGLR